MKKIVLPLSLSLLIGTTQLSAFSLSDVAGVIAQQKTTTPQTKTQTNELTEMLSKQLNISNKKASGGVGSILSYAESALAPNKFQTLESAIPNAKLLMSMAPKSSVASSGLGALAGSMSNSSVSKMATLASQFSSLGLSSDMISQFIPIIMQYFKSSHKTEAGNILSSLF
ncbi:hypothetical protein MNB_SM-5-1266 [hydrothermal vent metagenome]|uniref:DUF2780 domain-containing protein n=1 Tax=hydrothermal vent metagenome TaxID=652676 RepID=A0A1W1CRG0_9ZZZZ